MNLLTAENILLPITCVALVAAIVIAYAAITWFLFVEYNRHRQRKAVNKSMPFSDEVNEKLDMRWL